MRQEFRPGDRVRADFNPERVCFVVPDDPYHLFTASFANGVGPALTLVARPVYPEPGQVAVLLDETDIESIDRIVEALNHQHTRISKAVRPFMWTISPGKGAYALQRIRAILDRAREAIRP